MSLLSLTSLQAGKGLLSNQEEMRQGGVPLNYFFVSSSVLAMEARMSVSAITFFIL